MQKLVMRPTWLRHLRGTAEHPGRTMVVPVFVRPRVWGSELVMLLRLFAPVNGMVLEDVNSISTPSCPVPADTARLSLIHLSGPLPMRMLLGAL